MCNLNKIAIVVSVVLLCQHNKVEPKLYFSSIFRSKLSLIWKIELGVKYDAYPTLFFQ